MSIDYYPPPRVFDLRQEFHEMLFGSLDNPGIAQKVLVRRLLDKKCICFDDKTGSPNPACARCQGEGFQFVETLEACYMVHNFGSVQNPATVINQQNYLGDYGLTDPDRGLAFFEYSTFPNYERYLKPEHPSYDRLYELKVDDNGGLVQPAVRTAKWKMRSVTAHRGDAGRIEYFECGLEKEFV